jgi:DNA-directed RNA polymerase specialized sigma24 family protein
MERAIERAASSLRDAQAFATADDAFQHWVVPEIEVMLRVANSLTRDPGEAEDLVQDALIRAYRGIEGFDGQYPRAWLLTDYVATVLAGWASRYLSAPATAPADDTDPTAD